MKLRFFGLIIFLLFAQLVFPQSLEQTLLYRSDKLGNREAKREGTLNGNLVRTLFYNNGQVGNWVSSGYPGPSMEWPKGTQHNHTDGCTPVISTRTKAPGNNQTIYFCQSNYREGMDHDPTNSAITWGMEPVPGYTGYHSEEPALNTKPSTWPEEWPKVFLTPLVDNTWDGYWYGYFGRGVMNADVETFFALDDSKDEEWKRAPYNYYPVSTDPARGGMGLRMEVRGFQWSHVLAEDIIFWHYDIINISDYDYDSTFFGFYSDTGIGGWGDNGDDNASYSTLLDLTYAFDSDGTSNSPQPAWEPGYMGYAYLESPGDATDGIDNDEDGLTDERRDDGLDNDGDWVVFTDINGNGIWDRQLNEPLNDDLGNDGVGPFDPQYNGPDAGEGDGFKTAGEPNFDATDKDESDQIGLTSLVIKQLAGVNNVNMWFQNDAVMWNYMQPDTFYTSVQSTNIQILFGSGPFPLKKNLRERFSMALVMGKNEDDLVFNKETVQEIYNANYNFAQPPLKPILTAIPGDKKVSLFWDTRSEESRDRFLQGKKDFEGYLIYKSEEAEFQDIKTITDSKGEPVFWKPLVQYDLIDSISGPEVLGVNGAHFWMGSNSGLQHSYIDTDVLNGKRYYYACVAYDMGDPGYGTKGLLSTPTTKIITEELTGEITFIDINCAVVTPNASAAGYQAPSVVDPKSLDQVSFGLGTGSLGVTVLNPDSVKSGAEYKVLLHSSGVIPSYATTSYEIFRTYNGITDTAAVGDSSSFGLGTLGPLFDGIAISTINSKIEVDQEKTGWIVGYCNFRMPVQLDTGYVDKTLPYPSDYELEFLPAYTVLSDNNVSINFITKNLTRGDTVKVFVYDTDQNQTLSLGDKIAIYEVVNNQKKFTWLIGYYEGSSPFPAYPTPGSKFVVTTKKPFYEGDYFNFQMKGSSLNKEDIKNDLDKIGVVPNPYIASADWERKTISVNGRGERRIDFVNLPASCTVRIYTVAGALVKTLYKDSTPDNGSLPWNLVSDDGMDVAYGLYIFHVDVPGVGEKIGKFALIK
jgi:hypothetical protein